MGWPTKERDVELGEGKTTKVVQWIFVGLAVMMPTIITFAAYLLGRVD